MVMRRIVEREKLTIRILRTVDYILINFSKKKKKKNNLF